MKGSEEKQIIVKELLKRCDKERVKEYISKRYLDIDIFLEGNKKLKDKIKEEYIKTIDNLIKREIEIKNNNKEIIICKIYNTYKEEKEYYTFLIDIDEIKNTKELLDYEDINRYGIEFMDWDDILLSKINKKSIESYDINELVGELIRLMTLFGFNEEKNKKEKEYIINTLQEEDNEYKIKEYKSIEEVFKPIYNKLGIQMEERERKSEREIEEIIRRNKIIITTFIEETIKEKL